MFLRASLWSTAALEEAPEGWVRVGKQGREAHYKRRMNPEERQNISTTAGRGGERETEARWEAGRQRGKQQSDQDEDLKTRRFLLFFFLTTRTASLLYTTRRRDCKSIISTLWGICREKSWLRSKCRLQHLRRGQLLLTSCPREKTPN